MMIIRGSVRAGQFSGLGALSMGQRDAIINKWTDAKKLLPAVLTIRYPTQSLRDAAFAVDQALMDFRKGTMTDDAFGSKLTAVIVSIGDIADADGVLVMDMEGADGDKVRKFLDALPNMKGKVTVTGPDVRFESKVPMRALGVLGLLFIGYIFVTNSKSSAQRFMR
jgi:hypothetical protein